MSAENNGGPAFPVLDNPGIGLRLRDPGMTMRQYYAGQALAGFCANPSVFAANQQNGWQLVNCTDEQLTQLCNSLADAMIAAGDK